MNIYLKSAEWVGKILITILLAYFFVGLFSIRNVSQLAVGFFVIIFIGLPTIFIFFFKDKFLLKYPKFTKAWKIIKIIYIVIAILLVTLLVAGQYIANEKSNTSKAMGFIESKRITLDDVMGKNLPSQPDQKLNDSTIAGIDVNKNYIRDDVELAIFANYPNAAKIRAAELQYAQALQLELNQVYNSETLVAVMKKENRGIDCIGKKGPDVNLKDSHEKILATLSIVNKMEKEVENSVINNYSRKKIQSDNLNKYMAGYSSPAGEECDIDISLLPN